MFLVVNFDRPSSAYRTTLWIHQYAKFGKGGSLKENTTYTCRRRYFFYYFAGKTQAWCKKQTAITALERKKVCRARETHTPKVHESATEETVWQHCLHVARALACKGPLKTRHTIKKLFSITLFGNCHHLDNASMESYPGH